MTSPLGPFRSGRTAAGTGWAPDHLVGHLTGFVEDLRGRGIVVGPAALIDAASATEVLNLLDRSSFREGLACTLISDQGQRPVFDAVFDLWFPAGAGKLSGADELPTRPDGRLDVEGVRQAVAQMLADDTAENDGRLAAMISQIVDQVGGYQSARGPAFSTYEVMSTVRPQTLIAAIAAAMAAAAGDAEGGTQARYRRSAAGRVDRFGELVGAETRRRMAERKGREQVAEYGVPTLPEHIEFLAAGRAEMAALRRTIDPLARLLAAKLEVRRRRARRGVVDVRKTMRASMSTGGIPVELIYARPRPARPELVIMCDVSGSVSGFSQFTLQLVYALRQHFSAVRVFAFVDSVDEVTDFFARNPDDIDIAGAVGQMLGTARLITRDGHSDYGHALSGFAEHHIDSLTHRGALLILGDGRNNYHDARYEALRALVDRARHAYWLNPEARDLWGSGDSVADNYASIIEMHECRNAGQLGRVIADLLPV
ncbi:VWA domain-containing protein [Williamsia sp. CHRR-6]|uniref:vWA domain-containing protein n=1 Tax=Williamsia sp. CHRR-6 TaxID=2835871 RepID=UPI001BD9B109|nr:VWA domain-containing protein [Williamsia sp. CHRR-6]MBT0565417.1 VWA domain-containing protein [Williamsia sp. CHRR-6]